MMKRYSTTPLPPDRMTRRNMMLPDSLWSKVLKAAADEGAKRGKPMSAAEWVRGVLRKAVK